MAACSLRSLATAGALLGSLALAAPSDALMPPGHSAYLQFNGAVALPGVVLQPGVYVFELALPLSEMGVVRVSSPDRRTVYLTAFTYSIPRPRNLRANQLVQFGEPGEGGVTPITAWFPEDMDQGRQFIYR